MDQPLAQTLAQEILAKLPDGILITDSEHHVIWRNDAMQSLLCADMPAENPDQPLFETAILPFLTAQGTFPLFDGDSEQQRWLHHSSLALDNGQRVHIYKDISETKYFQRERDHLIEQLRSYVSIDPLTGLLTESALVQGLEPLVSLSRRYDKPLSLAVLTLANLDQLHIEGRPLDSDLVRVAVSQILKDQMRWADLIAITAVGQFVLVLPETTKESAQRLADKLHSKLSPLPSSAELSLPQVDLHSSIHVTEWTRSDSAQTLLARALAA